MMLSSNFNGSFIQPIFQNQQKLPNQQYATSVESNQGSLGASSLLTAANTLIFNSPPSSSSLSSSYIKSPFTQLKAAASQSPKQKSGSFSRQLLELQHSNQQHDLDFDLNYNQPLDELNQPQLTKLDEINLSLKTIENNKQLKSVKIGDYLFNDDEDQLEFDQDETNDDQFDNEDDNSTNSSVLSMKRMDQNNDLNLNKILDNPIGYSFNRMSQNQSKFMPIEQVKSDNIVNSIRKVNFLDENSPISSLSSYVGASFTPTSNFNDSTPQNSVSAKHSTSRTLMKLQLMKQQTEQSEKKAAAALSNASSLSHHDSMNTMIQEHNSINKMNEMSSTITNEINMPSSLTSSEIIPRNSLPQAFQTETKLENPTKYHVMQIAKNLQQSCSNSQMSPTAQILTSKKVAEIHKSKPTLRHQRQTSVQSNQQASSLNNSLRENTNSLASSGDISILPNSSSFYSDCAFNDKLSQHSFDSHNSNLDLNLLSSPTSSSFSQADYIDEIDDLVPDELNSFTNKRSLSTNLTNLEMQEEINRIEECLNLPKTLPSDYLKMMSPSMTQSVRESTSCPTDIARLKKLKGINLTEDEIKLIVKDRQKKDNHNMIERRRRFNINDRIKELGSILPKANQGEIKQNKGSILKASVDYIKNLQYEVKRTKELGDKFNQMTLLNRKLVNRIKELESLKLQPNEEDMNVIHIKQEPQASSLFNLVTSSDYPELITKNNIQNLSKSANQLRQPQFYLTSHQHQQQQIIQHQQLLNDNNMNLDVLLNNCPNNLFTNEQNVNMATDSEVFFNDSLLLDEILDSPIKNQNDPLISDHNIYNDNLMDSLS